MSFREFVEKKRKEGKAHVIGLPVSKRLQASAILKKLDGRPVVFEKVKESDFRVAGNVFSTKELVADYFGIRPSGLIPKMIEAIEKPTKPAVVDKAPCQEVVEPSVDLDKLPLLFHCEKDGGNYISSGVVIAAHPGIGTNMSFHRCMQIGKDRLVARILERHLNEIFKKTGGDVDIAICVGCSPNVLLAAATSVELGRNELEIANTLEPLRLVKCRTNNLLVPADCEFVLEGKLTAELADEGPFVDLTGTYDFVRKQQVIKINCITHRKDAVWHALLPGALEHKVLMGMPREPTIFREVSKVCKCLDVNINPGGCSWLHAIVQIDKRNEDDGKKAIEAAFKGHSSMKHCFVVDRDIDIYDPVDVEWAMATRFQGDKGMIIKTKEKGSSLDPSADPVTRETTKVGFDFTKPVAEIKGKDYSKVRFPEADMGLLSGHSSAASAEKAPDRSQEAGQTGLQLTQEQKDMLEGRHGNAVKKSMGILVALANIYGARRLLPVTSVQISGVSYDNLGDAGLEFLEEMASDGKVRVRTTLNPAGMDMENWKALGIPEDFAKKQVKVIEAFKKMGVDATCSCTPYLIGNKPGVGEHIAWGESSAVTYANSVLGARTNKEGGPSTIASALTGLTPEYGLHLDENRRPAVLVEVEKVRDPVDYGALGKVLGEALKGKIPLIRGIAKAGVDELKSLSASIVTYGGAPIFHIEGITPEQHQAPAESIKVTKKDIRKAIRELNDDVEGVDFIFIGCPHCSLKELKKIAKLLNGKRVRKELWIGVARPIKAIADKKGISKIIEDSGAKFACDTCHVVAPLKGRFKTIATNSAKGVYYGRAKNDFKTYFAPLKKCIEVAV